MEDFWSNLGKDLTSGVLTAGADVLRKNSERASRANNADVSPGERSMKPWMMYAGAAMAAALVYLLIRKR